MTLLKRCAIGLHKDPVNADMRAAGKKRPPNQTGGWDGGASHSGNIDRELGEITAKRFQC